MFKWINQVSCFFNTSVVAPFVLLHNELNMKASITKGGRIHSALRTSHKRHYKNKQVFKQCIQLFKVLSYWPTHLFTLCFISCCSSAFLISQFFFSLFFTPFLILRSSCPCFCFFFSLLQSFSSCWFIAALLSYVSQCCWVSCLLHTFFPLIFFQSFLLPLTVISVYCLCVCVSRCHHWPGCFSECEIQLNLSLFLFTRVGCLADGYPLCSRATSPGTLVGQLLFSYHTHTHTHERTGRLTVFKYVSSPGTLL